MTPFPRRNRLDRTRIARGRNRSDAQDHSDDSVDFEVEELGLDKPRARNKGIQAVKYVNAVKASPMALATKAMPRTDRNPTLAQAEKSTTWDLWSTAIGMEMNMLKGMNSYDLITRPQVPRGCQLLQSKMDLKTKINAMGEVTKREARLVALGNLEWESIRDTYAPTVNAKTINLILALAAQERMILYGLDIFGAFLNAEIG